MGIWFSNPCEIVTERLREKTLQIRPALQGILEEFLRNSMLSGFVASYLSLHLNISAVQMPAPKQSARYAPASCRSQWPVGYVEVSSRAMVWESFGNLGATTDLGMLLRRPTFRNLEHETLVFQTLCIHIFERHVC
jgi:hypothetical protein